MLWIVMLLGLLFLGVFAVMLMSFTVAWYEKANAHPELIDQRFRPAALTEAARLILCETLAVYLSIVLHPLGYLPPKRPQSTDSPPIVLLHGLFQNRICWWLVVFRLRRLGHTNLHILNLPPWKDVETLTERLDRKVDRLRLEQGGARVTLIGHSMGGLIGRNYLQLRGGAQKVARLITLGSPHGGSRLAPFALSPMGKDLLPKSPFLERLSAAEVPQEVALYSLYSPQDNLVLPPQSARWESAQNRQINGVGHTSLLYSSAVVAQLAEILMEESP